MPQAALFDMDGLMLDTEPLWTCSWEPALCALGRANMPPGLPDEMRGAGPAARQEVLDRHFGARTIDQAALWERVCAHMLEVCRDGAPKKAGLIELLDHLREWGVPRAVASSSARPMIERQLAAAGMDACFDVVLSGEEVVRGKPAPDVFLEAARRLGVAPASSLVLEDGKNGVLAGAAGGFVTVLVPDLVAPDDEMLSAASFVCRDLLEVRGLLASGVIR